MRRMVKRARPELLLLTLLMACSGGAGEVDANTGGDAATPDGSDLVDAAGQDAADAAVLLDATTDAEWAPDAPLPDAPNGTGLTVPCLHGPGYTLFRFHYEPNNGQNPRLDVWDATCTYSYAPGSICRIDAIGSIGTANGGWALAFDGSDYLRVRFSVNGLDFTEAAVYVQARSLSTSSSTDFRVWSPIYGSAYGGPVDNDFVYDWYGVDWTGYLYPDDAPGLTAIQVYPYTGSGNLGIAAVELCVR